MINLLGLIQMYNSYDRNSIYHSVATCLVKNYRLLDTMAAPEIADMCNVSVSTLNRFFKKMAYPLTVSKLPDLVSVTKDNYLFDGSYIPLNTHGKSTGGINDYMTELQARISLLQASVDRQKLAALAEDIHMCQKVVFLGCPIPQAVWRFQMDLVMKGIDNSAFMDPNYQYEALDYLEDNSIVFYTQYVRMGDDMYKKRIIENKDRIKKLVLLTSIKRHSMESMADYLFSYIGNGTEQDNILMNIYINLMALSFRGEC